MRPLETAKSYDVLASHWNGPEFNRLNGVEQHQRALRFVKGGSKALDVGCGSSGRFIDMLLDQGFEVEGLDISPKMIACAKARHPEQTFHLADICDWEFTEFYDFITAWDSVWHVPLDRQESILEKLCGGLKPGGVLIFTSGGTDEPGEVTNPCMDQPLYHATPGIPNILNVISRAGCVCRHLEYDQHPELHVYFIVQKPE